MDWANERWVRIYTRDTTTWKMLDWRARTVFMHLMRKVDRAGVLDVGETGTLGLSAVLDLPIEIVEPGIERLLHPKLRVVIATPTAYVVPNFLEAQEATQTTNHRSAEYRARKRDFALAAASPDVAEVVGLSAPAHPVIDLPTEDVTPRDGAVTKRDASVTPHHAASLLSDPIRSKISHSLPRGAAPRALPPPTATPPEPALAEPALAEPTSSGWHRRQAWWSAMLEADARIKSAGIEPNAPVLPRVPAGENERQLVACERQLVDGGYDAATVDAKMRHIVLVAEAEAMRERHRRWFKPAVIWDPRRAARAADTAIDEVAAPRAGPRAVAPKDVRTGRVEPKPPSAYHDGEIDL